MNRDCGHTEIEAGEPKKDLQEILCEEVVMNQSEIFEKIYRDYLDEVSSLDLKGIKDRLGIELDEGEAIIPFFGARHRISRRSIVDEQGRRPSHSVSVILCKYLLMCPKTEPSDADWVTYREFKDAAPFVRGFADNAEKPVGRLFSGRLSDLERAAGALAGRLADLGIASDLVMEFDALPRVPMLMLFNDRDEDFPAQCSLLFRKGAEKYLDMECLAMIGLVLPERLKRSKA